MSILRTIDQALLTLADRFVLFVWDQFSLSKLNVVRSLFFLDTLAYLLADNSFFLNTMMIIGNAVVLAVFQFLQQQNKQTFYWFRGESVYPRVFILMIMTVFGSADLLGARWFMAAWCLCSILEPYAISARNPPDPPKRRWPLTDLFPEPEPSGAR